MPTSPNRRRVEIAATLFEELQARADREGTTVATVLHAVIVDGLAMQEMYGQLAGDLADVKRRVEWIADRFERDTGAP